MDTHMTPPTHLEPDYLYEKYEPLRKAMFNKFQSKMSNVFDKEDLLSAIDESFIELVNEYNPDRGVDFPYYIKKMLNFRVYHYVTTFLKNHNRETYEEEEIIITDDSTEELLERVVELASLDPNIVLGEKHRNLMIGVIIEGKTLKQLAEEEGVPPDRLHARLYFLIQKMKKEYSKLKEQNGGQDLYK